MSNKSESKNKIARAYGKELKISPKHSVEICNFIKGMLVSDAKRVLEDVVALKRPIPYKKYKRKLAHRRDLQGWYAGRYPVKAATHILRLLKGVEANAAYKGLNTEKLRIIHIAASKGRVIKGYRKGMPFNKSTTNIEVIVEEE